MELKSHIVAKDISFKYTEKAVLNRISFNVARGEVVSILGPNGSGEKHLIKIILGFLRPLKGRIMFNGNNVGDMNSRHLAREIAYVPQIHRSIFPYMVIDVVLMGRIPHKRFFFKYSREDIDIAHEALKRLSIQHLAERAYTEISGGERQLTIIARALAQGAKTLIMDEPAGGLDYGNQFRLLEEIMKLAGEGYTFIKSTHSPEHALWISDRVIMIRDGAIVADGKSKDVINSENLNSLYKIKVDIEHVNGATRICVPQSMCRCSANQSVPIPPFN